MRDWRLRVTALALLALLGLAACGRPPAVYSEQFLAMGTLIEVKLAGVDEAQGRAATARIKDDFAYMHETWHAWHPGALGRINELLPTGARFSAAPSTLPLIVKGQEFYRTSGGLFNPAMGNLIRLWGFASDEPPKGPPPSAAAIAELVTQHPTMDDVHVEGIEIYSTNPAVRIDMGGYAKGYAIDRGIDHLREMGIKNAIVNAGGNMRVIGSKGGKPWRIGIRDPRQDGILAYVDMANDESISTSGDYERYFEYEGVRYHHIIDPRTGYPARGAIATTVFHRDGASADAASTALLIAGPGQWLPVARAMGVHAALVIDEQGRIEMTPDLRERIHFEPDKHPVVTYTGPL